MTSEERRQLREKHQEITMSDLSTGTGCRECVVEYPCDTTRVLDALDDAMAHTGFACRVSQG